jgi:hypothetical protein
MNADYRFPALCRAFEHIQSTFDMVEIVTFETDGRWLYQSLSGTAFNFNNQINVSILEEAQAEVENEFPGERVVFTYDRELHRLSLIIFADDVSWD